MKTGTNRQKRTIIFTSIALIVSLLIKIASLYPAGIEKYYSRGIYPTVALFYRNLLGWIPISIGDVLYAVSVFILLLLFIRFVKNFRTRKLSPINFRGGIFVTLFVLAVIYVYFNLAWGLNYNRQGIAYQLGLSPERHHQSDLQLISSLLVRKVNEKRLSLRENKITSRPYKKIFSQASEAYSSLSSAFPFLEYRKQSVKPSLFGQLGGFVGISGYFNPFSGEAQVNVTQPNFVLPFVTCHEMAHQLGYASESEANFVGFLAASNSSDTLFQYSAYFDLFNYANRELYLRDSNAAKTNYNQLDTLVKKDEIELYEYWRQSDNLIEPIIKIFYDRYLKANQQVQGVKSYNEVIGWLIAYYKKYGKI